MSYAYVKKVSSSYRDRLRFLSDLALNPIVKSTENGSAVACPSTPVGEATHLKDASKPDGEARRDDGTLKDASEMEWLYSPSQSHSDILGEKRNRDDGVSDDDDDDIDVLPETKVSTTFHC